MQNVPQDSSTENNPRIDKVNVGTSSPPQTANSSPTKSETETNSEHRRYMSDSSESEEDSVSEVESFIIDQEFEVDSQVETAKFLLSQDENRAVDPETQARLEALLQAAGISKLGAKDGKHLGDPEVLRRLTSSVSCALDEAAAALTRMRSDNPRTQPEKTSLVEACTDGDVGTVRKLLTEGRSVHETSEEGESLLSLACSAGYFELAQVLIAMHANVEDRGIKGECTPLMEAASAGHLDIVRLLVAHGADVNAQSTSGNTPLMYGCAGGHTEVVKFLLQNGANVEDHNENGHTPLMEAASAGHVDLAKILLEHGAGINTHSNEFKESALTLACYKGHLDMVRFLLKAGADQEHKTDEMHTALMEASMDGHVEVAKLLLDSGAQVNMPTDSFESPLTLAACGGHVDLAMLLIERGANIEEVNDEGYTPLMEAAREGHEEMVHLLLGQGANINAQTDETQETALTLACCGGFTEVADILLKGGADIELGASTPLMEAAQEGHLDLVRFLLENGANVHSQTQTGDTALTYACENGHTDVADVLLQCDADLEHESEGGRTPLMKACRAGHMCTVQFLILRGANVRKPTTNNDHTPLSLACAGGHLQVVELLLSHNADPNHKLKDNSTMLIEAAKGGHTNVVQLLLDYPHSMQPMMLNQPGATRATNLSMLPGQVGSRESPLPPGAALPTNLPSQPINFFSSPTSAVLQEVPEAVRIVQQEDANPSLEVNSKQQQVPGGSQTSRNTSEQNKIFSRKSILPKSCATAAVFDGNLTTAEAQQNRTQPLNDFEDDVFSATAAMEFLNKEDPNSSLIDFIKNRKKQYNIVTSSTTDEGSTQKQQILEELHRVERELHGKHQAHNNVFQYTCTQEQCPSTTTNTLPHMLNLDIAMQQKQQGAATCLQSPGLKLAVGGDSGVYTPNQTQQPAFYFTPLPTTVGVSLTTATTTAATQPIKFQSVTSHIEVSQSTAISDRPKAKPVSKKEGKTVRKQQQQQVFQPNLYGQQPSQIFELLQPTAQQQFQPQQQQEILNVPTLDLDSIDQESLDLKEDSHENLLTASILQQFHHSSIRAAFIESSQNQDDSKVTNLELTDKDFSTVDDVVHTLESFDPNEVIEHDLGDHNLQVQPYPSALDESMIASLASPQELADSGDLSQVEYFAVPTKERPAAVDALSKWVDPDLVRDLRAASKMPNRPEAFYQAGLKHGYRLSMSNRAASCSSGTLTTTTVTPIQATHHCQLPCTQHQQSPQATYQVQAATQTPQTTPSSAVVDAKKIAKATPDGMKFKKGRILRHQNQTTPGATNLQQNLNYQIDHNSAITQYSGANQKQCAAAAVAAPGMDVDSETESNHDTALTLACAGGHEELVELLINRGADIEHRDKKGFTPLILAATAGHEKVVDILLNHNADIEAQSERTKDTPLSLACSGGRYEVVELLLTRNANKEHRNVSDYTPLSLAASGGYVNIIKLLLSHGAEINSRTGSKLGISPLMLAAMNGHTAAVKLLLDMGSDINAQIETNRNTALTLACFQGRHEVVSLLLDRKANVEHRAKTGLTPLMEAASGGYVEVGRVLLDKGAEVNATPVPSSRDTALTIAADKGHIRFVDLLLDRGAQVEVKNKKGNSPLWLAANGGHIGVVELLYNVNADIDSQDNRKVSCLMAAFRKGHVKIVKWMVHNVTQFPSDQEMIRYISTVSDRELLDKCHECVKVIRAAKETQAAKANKNASILLEELDMEKTREESKRLAAARKRERKKKKKLEKKEEKRKLLEENKKNENYDEKDKKSDEETVEEDENVPEPNVSIRNGGDSSSNDKEEGDSGIDANSQGSCSSNDIKSKENRKDKKKKKSATLKSSVEIHSRSKASSSTFVDIQESPDKSDKIAENKIKSNLTIRKGLVFEATKSPAERDDFEATGSEVYVSSSKKKSNYEIEPPLPTKSSLISPKQSSKREEGWKEVVRKSSVQTVSTADSGVKKVSVPLNAISRVIGRGGSNINAIRGATGAHIEVEKQSKGQGERIITIKGSPEATKQAHNLITTLIKDPEVDILQMLPKANKIVVSTTTLWDKTQIATKKNAAGKALVSQAQIVAVNSSHQKPIQTIAPSVTVSSRLSTTSSSSTKMRSIIPIVTSRVTAPRLAAQAEKYVSESSQYMSRLSLSHASTTQTNKTTITTKVTTTTPSQTTFAAKLTAETSSAMNLASIGVVSKPRSGGGLASLGLPMSTAGPVSPQAVVQPQPSISSPNKNSTRPTPTASAPPSMQHFQSPGKVPPAAPYVITQATTLPVVSDSIANMGRSSTPNLAKEEVGLHGLQQTSEYSLFYTSDSMWRRETESQKPINFAAVTGGGNAQVQTSKYIDQEPVVLNTPVSKAPGYRGGAVCSPVSSKTSSNSTTPPNISRDSSFQNYQEAKSSQQTLPPIGSSMHSRAQTNADYYGDIFKSGVNMMHDSHLYMPYSQQQQQQQGNLIQSASRLNPKAPDFAAGSSTGYNANAMNKNQHVYNGFQMNSQQNNYQMGGSGKCAPSNSYHRNNVAQQNTWLLQMQQQPLQNELISGIAGMTIHGIARAAGGEILENGGDMNIVNSSPTMSPNLHHENHYMEERKPPQPIGTGRKVFANPLDHNWMLNNDSKGGRWPASNLTEQFSTMGRNQGYPDEIPALDYFVNRGMPPESTHNYGPPFFPAQIGSVRQDFIAGDALKMDLGWDTTTRNNLELQEKQQGWKWNQ